MTPPKITRRHAVKTAAATVLAPAFHRETVAQVPAGKPDRSTLDMVKHLDLGGMNLLGCLNPEESHLPYFHMAVDRDFKAEYQFRRDNTGHNVGRWWNAMLRLQALTGFNIPAPAEAAMLKNTWRMTDNPTGILLDAPDPAQPHTWYLHSYRETMLALGLLVSHRDNPRAREQGLRAIARMRKASQNLRHPQPWDFSSAGGPAASLEQPAPYTHGRAIEGLLCFHEATGAPEALEEAERLAEFHFRHTVNPDGSLGRGCGRHMHSYLNTLCGLLLLAGRNRQQRRLEILHATYRNAVSAMITRSGFITHDIGDARVRSGGDIAAAGDIAHIALLLFEHFPDPALLDDAERLVRGRLIPAQVLEPMPLKPWREEPRDSLRDLPQRFVGAIGGSVGHVKGQTCTTDFTAAALHTLIELYRRAVDLDEQQVRVNFHFGCQRPGVIVRSDRGPTEATVDIRNDTGKDTLVRIPGWAPATSLRLFVNDRPADLATRKGFAFIAGNGQPNRVRLHFTLPEEQHREAWRESEATQEFLVFHWRGDEITAVDPVGRYLEPFPKECRRL